MTFAEYRIESNHPISNRLLPQLGAHPWFVDPSHAVAIAAKCVPNAYGEEVRVVHVPSGEVIFTAAPHPNTLDRMLWSEMEPV